MIGAALLLLVPASIPVEAVPLKFVPMPLRTLPTAARESPQAKARVCVTFTVPSFAVSRVALLTERQPAAISGRQRIDSVCSFIVFIFRRVSVGLQAA